MHRLRERLNDQRGFTLTELMVLITIFGILMAIAVPSINQQISSQQLRSSARELVSVLRDARSAAINEGIPRYVILRPGTPGSYQVYRYAGGSWTPAHNEVRLKGKVGFTEADVTVPSVSGAPVSGASVPADAVYFDTRGRYPLGHSGVFTITLRAQVGDPLTLSFYPQTGQVTGP